MSDGRPELKRVISLPLLVAYGVGTMIGGGIYALLGQMALYANMHAPVAILIAAAIALLTAMSFAELTARLPFSAGPPKYVDEAFGQRWLSISVGWGVIATGVVSAATLSSAFVRFSQDLIDIPTNVGICFAVAFLTAIAVRGILESVWLATTITIIEVGGLFWVVAVNAKSLLEIPERLPELVPGLAGEQWLGIATASFFAFYAFIGFEDMANQSEEVKDARRNVPRGILLSLAITTVIYVLIGLIAVVSVSPKDLAHSQTPLALLVSAQGPYARVLMVLVSMLAGVNGALVQIVMASRVVYGMSNQGMGPSVLASVHPELRTPIIATLLIGALILLLALWLPLESLAKCTSGIMLANFALVNASLVRLKWRADEVGHDIVQYPIAVPFLGCILCVSFLVIQLVIAPQ